MDLENNKQEKRHFHTYNNEGEIECCHLEEKINLIADQPKDKTSKSASALKPYIPSIITFVLLMLAIVFDKLIKPDWYDNYVRLGLYILAYAPVALPVIKDAWKATVKKDLFSEFTLMVIATIGAFYIGEYPEAVAVMLFYSIGELFQSAAVRKAKGNIKALLDLRPDSANVIKDDKVVEVAPENVHIGEKLQVRSGEKVPLDGVLLSDHGILNTAALTGESVPVELHKDAEVLAGMINEGPVLEVHVTKEYADSSLSRILEMVENAASQKAPTELFIRKFARVYTPIVVGLAAALTFLPYLFVEQYIFNDWLYRALIFLVISCPCALVISIPLGYFGGIGAASKNGILFKGSNYLDAFTKVNTVVMDKTGTLTKGIFQVEKIKSESMNEQDFLNLVASVEKNSTHPIAKAIVDASDQNASISVNDVNEIPGHGLQAMYNDQQILVGNARLLQKNEIIYPEEINAIVESIVVVGLNGKYEGYITVSDQIKEDAKSAIEELNKQNITPVMLSGDKQSIVSKVANVLNIKQAFGGLLPQDKVSKVQEIKKDPNKVVAFIGDGINDAPVLAMSDVGVAMGAMGSDAAIETADVVIQTDHPSKINTAIEISRATKKIVIQNIVLAFGVKLLVLALGAGGIATMWEAVFADVGVALLAILNAIRIQRMKF
ncbi:MAG: cadmium-translocating P-type ATPase [Crocinitomicaceae bacterium]|nr:cadmium-translocating P-type ATPase [Crocinitomicaceae bacterium]